MKTATKTKWPPLYIELPPDLAKKVHQTVMKSNGALTKRGLTIQALRTFFSIEEAKGK